MKRSGVWGLLFCLILCIGTRGAAEECTHAYQKFVSHVNEQYEEAGFSGHRHIYDEREFYGCTLCGHILLDRISREAVEELAMHSYEGGVCTECSYENPCRHLNGTSTEITENPTGENGFQTIDEWTHGGTGVRTRIVWCDTCLESLSREILEEEIEIVQKHHFLSGVCSGCGYINLCEHPRTTGEEWMENAVYEIADGETHTMTADIVLYVSCSLCLEELEPQVVQAGYSAREAHILGDGYCVRCGWVNPCAHDGEQSSELHIWDRECSPINMREHVVRGPLYEVLCCRECGQTITSWPIDPEGCLYEYHAFRDGVCTECGYTNECEHQSAKSRVYIDSTDKAVQAAYGEEVRVLERPDAFEMLDAQRHAVRGDRREETVCMDCGAVVSDILLEEDAEEIEAHRMNGLGRCVVCGYACLHEEITSYDEWMNAEYAPLDEKSHQISGNRYVVEICRMCSIEFSRHLAGRDEQEIKPHAFIDNVCRDCGAVSECTHEQKHLFSTVNGAVCTPVDGWLHTVSGELTWLSSCLNCNAVFPLNETGIPVERMEMHVPDQGVCVRCGGESACAHELIKEYAYSADQQYTPLDGRTHLAAGSIRRWNTCRECLAFLGDEAVDGQNEAVSEHTYMNGRCVQCGYICPHETMDALTYFAGASYARHDAEEHEIFGMYCRGSVCAVCGIERTEEVIELYAERTEPHAFEDGACVRCGEREP